MSRKRSSEITKPEKPPSVWNYPGISPIGSLDDRAIRERSVEVNAIKKLFPGFFGVFEKAEGEAVFDDELDMRESMPMPNEWLESPDVKKLSQTMDRSAIILIDWRLRFCRRMLDFLNFPYDNGYIIVTESLGGYLEWQYASAITEGHAEQYDLTDPLDFNLSVLPHHCEPWYAAKILAHARRAKHISESRTAFKNKLPGLMREWMLFGQTWAEAKFVGKHTEPILRGRKTLQAANDGALARKNALAADTNGRLAEMARLVQSGHPVKGAAEAIARKGMGMSWQANRALWYRHNPKNL